MNMLGVVLGDLLRQLLLVPSEDKVLEHVQPEELDSRSVEGVQVVRDIEERRVRNGTRGEDWRRRDAEVDDASGAWERGEGAECKQDQSYSSRRAKRAGKRTEAVPNRRKLRDALLPQPLDDLVNSRRRNILSVPRQPLAESLLLLLCRESQVRARDGVVKEVVGHVHCDGDLRGERVGNELAVRKLDAEDAVHKTRQSLTRPGPFRRDVLGED